MTIIEDRLLVQLREYIDHLGGIYSDYCPSGHHHLQGLAEAVGKDSGIYGQAMQLVFVIGDIRSILDGE